MKKMSSLKHTQAGVTLVELMIGLTVGLVVTGGAMAILFGNQKMLLEKGRLDRTQEEFRFATTTITRLIRQANSFSVPASNNELVINFDSSQRDCLGVTGLSSSNTLKFDNNQLLCIRDNDPDTPYILAKNIGSLQFSYGTQQSGAVTYNSYFSTGTTVNTAVKNVLNNISSIKTKISIAQDGLTQQPTLEFIATSHQKSITANLSSGGVTSPPVVVTPPPVVVTPPPVVVTPPDVVTPPVNSNLEQIILYLKIIYISGETTWGAALKAGNSDINPIKVTKNTKITIKLTEIHPNNLSLSNWEINTHSIANLAPNNSLLIDTPNGAKKTFKLELKNSTSTSTSTLHFETQ